MKYLAHGSLVELSYALDAKGLECCIAMYKTVVKSILCFRGLLLILILKNLVKYLKWKHNYKCGT